MVFKDNVLGADARTAGQTVRSSSTTSKTDIELIDEHEGLHTWQQRVFGPAQHIGTIGFEVGGRLYGGIHAAFSSESFADSAHAAGYLNSPFEHQAYQEDGNGSSPVPELTRFR